MKIPDLRRAVSGLSQGEILIPALRTTLNDPSFGGFNVEIAGFAEKRIASGRWSPSTHSTWNVRQLALYRMAPEIFIKEPLNFTGTFAVTQGQFWHAFVAHVLKGQGILEKDEVRFIDEEYQRSGFADGLLTNGEVYELKTINSSAARKLESADQIKTLKYQYWCQVQEYMDIFDAPRARMLFLTPDYPFPMKEFVIEADRSHQAERRAAYAKAIQIAATGTLPLSRFSVPCCGKPEQCPARRGCVD